MKIKFNKDFLWGGAASAEQTEGLGNIDKSPTVWDELFKNEPSLFYEKIGPNVTNDFTNKYKEDIKMFSKIKVNSVRLGFSWARLFLDGKKINNEAVEYYHNVLDELIKYNIKPVMCLFHFDMPLWAQEKGGFESFEVVNDFAKYAEFLFKEYGDKVFMYATMNEPIVPIFNGYLGGVHYPRVNDPKRAAQYGFGTILAHAKAVNIFNDKFSHLKAKIGVVINVSPAYPKDNINYTSEDKKAADDFNVLHNFSMLDPMLKGEFPQRLVEILKQENIMPKFDQEMIDEVKRVKVDYVGMNFYAPARVQEPQDKNPEKFISNFASFYKWDKARMNVFRGWEIYPKAIYDASKLLKERYNNIPFFISENGMGVQNEDKYRDKKTGEINDDYRIAFIKEHLEQISIANSEGANCFGYHLWAITDNWSWANAYKNRYGFIEVDLKDQSRKFKKSAHWFKTVIENNGFNSNYKKTDEVIDLDNIDYVESLNG